MGGERGPLQGLCALALSALLLCGCSSQISYWDVGMVPTDGPEAVELTLPGGDTRAVKRDHLLKLRNVVHNLAVAAGLRIDQLLLTDEPGLNAMAGRDELGRSYIAVTTWMLDFVADDTGQMAGVVGHEIGHLALNHQQSRKASPRARSDPIAFSHNLERQADEFAVRIAFTAGYDTEGLLRWNRRMLLLTSRARLQRYLSTHPSFQEREADISRVVSGFAAATRQSKALQLWASIGLYVEQRGDALVVARLRPGSKGSLRIGDRIVATEEPVRWPVANLDDLFKTVSLDQRAQAFRFSVIRYGARISADFHSDKVP